MPNPSQHRLPPAKDKPKRVFRITLNGLEEWVEDAEGRCMVEVQHKLATGMFKGSSIRIREQWLTGARSKPVLDDEEED